MYLPQALSNILDAPPANDPTAWTYAEEAKAAMKEYSAAASDHPIFTIVPNPILANFLRLASVYGIARSMMLVHVGLNFNSPQSSKQIVK